MLLRRAAIAMWMLGSLASAGCSDSPRGKEAFAGAPLRTQTLADDVRVEILAEGEGPPAAPGDWVIVHYRLTLEDGTEADNSHGRKPLAFFLGKDSKLIEGFHRGVDGMRRGELRRATVPSRLGYGERSVGPIPANAPLVFELELMRLDK